MLDVYGFSDTPPCCCSALSLFLSRSMLTSKWVRRVLISSSKPMSIILSASSNTSCRQVSRRNLCFCNKSRRRPGVATAMWQPLKTKKNRDIIEKRRRPEKEGKKEKTLLWTCERLWAVQRRGLLQSKERDADEGSRPRGDNCRKMRSHRMFAEPAHAKDIAREIEGLHSAWAENELLVQAQTWSSEEQRPASCQSQYTQPLQRQQQRNKRKWKRKKQQNRRKMEEESKPRTENVNNTQAERKKRERKHTDHISSWQDSGDALHLNWRRPTNILCTQGTHDSSRKSHISEPTNGSRGILSFEQNAIFLSNFVVIWFRPLANMRRRTPCCFQWVYVHNPLCIFLCSNQRSTIIVDILKQVFFQFGHFLSFIFFQKIWKKKTNEIQRRMKKEERKRKRILGFCFRSSILTSTSVFEETTRATGAGSGLEDSCLPTRSTRRNFRGT